MTHINQKRHDITIEYLLEKFFLCKIISNSLIMNPVSVDKVLLLIGKWRSRAMQTYCYQNIQGR